MTTDTSKLARGLIEARRQGKLASYAPETAPAGVAEAMLVQKEVMAAIGETVAGWKVGYTPDGIPVGAPIYNGVTCRSGATLHPGPSGKSGIEVEIALLLGKDLPPRPERPYGRDEILEASEALLAGIEIVESRFPAPPKPPFIVLLADNISNGAYARGKEVKDFRGLDLSRLRCRLAVDGRNIHDGVGGHAKGDPLAPVIDYANNPCDLMGGLKAGQFVTTGTLNGCPFIEGACKVMAEIEGLGRVELEIRPPRSKP